MGQPMVNFGEFYITELEQSWPCIGLNIDLNFTYFSKSYYIIDILHRLI